MLLPDHGDTMTMLRTLFRTCTLCEAMCGLKLELDGDRIVSVRGDEDDPFSQGYICPKGVAIGDVHHDPDRRRTPLRRAADGSFAPIGWDEALDLVEQRLHAVRAQGGADAIAVYMGNPIIGAVALFQRWLCALEEPPAQTSGDLRRVADQRVGGRNRDGRPRPGQGADHLCGQPRAFSS
jgi:anaerobic selenocysteine-containing dehydrogenase